jgi:hypothetical protein
MQRWQRQAVLPACDELLFAARITGPHIHAKGHMYMYW